MSKSELARTIAFATPKDLGLWREMNYVTKSELWVKMFKKNTGIQGETWGDVVVEVLRWGRIDGIKRLIDDQTYFQRITSRKARSNWSKRNREPVERLISEGWMMESGLVQVRAAKADGRWQNVYAVSQMEVPADFLVTLESKPKPEQFLETLTDSSHYVIDYGLISAKIPETRKRRFEVVGSCFDALFAISMGWLFKSLLLL